MTPKLADAELDLKKLRTLYGKYGAQQIIEELKRMKPAKVGAPKKVYQGSLLSIYAFIEARRKLRRGMSVLQAARELERLLRKWTVDTRYSTSRIRGMYDEGKALVQRSDVCAENAARQIEDFSAQLVSGAVVFPIIFKVTSGGELRGAIIDTLGGG